jgi:hypothetical protein
MYFSFSPFIFPLEAAPGVQEVPLLVLTLG